MKLRKKEKLICNLFIDNLLIKILIVYYKDLGLNLALIIILLSKKQKCPSTILKATLHYGNVHFICSRIMLICMINSSAKKLCLFQC